MTPGVARPKNAHASGPSPAALPVHPFRFVANPRVPWLAGPHGDVLTDLRSAVLGGGGALVLTGEAGTGKTVIANTLAALMRLKGMAVGRLGYPIQRPENFFQAVGEAFGWPDVRPETVAETAERCLADAQARDTRALLIVEDAQRLGPNVPAQIARLVKLARRQGADRRSPLSVLLVGDGTFLELLGSPANAELESVIEGRHELRPLTEDEVRAYIEHRLIIAESPPDLFTGPATKKIAQLSGGVTRVINALCDRALTEASRQGVRNVGPKLVTTSADDVNPERSARSPERPEVAPVEAPSAPTRVRKTYRNALLAGVGGLVLVALPSAYTVRHIRPQVAVARVAPPSVLQPPSTGHIPASTSGVSTEEEPDEETSESERDLPSAMAPAGGASGIDPSTAMPPPPSQTAATMPAPPPKTTSTPPVTPPPPRPALTASAPAIPARTLREPAAPRPESPPTVSRPSSRPPGPAPTRGPALDARRNAEPDPSSVIDWLLREAPRTAN